MKRPGLSARGWLVTLLILCWVQTVQAALPKMNISVSPSYIEAEILPGSVYTQSVTVSNDGDVPFNVTVYAGEWGSPGGETASSLTEDRSASRWISFSQDSFFLNPGEAREIKVAVTVPFEASGGYYATVFFEARYKVRSSLTLAGRLGVPVMVSTRGKAQRQVSIRKIQVTPPGESNPLAVEVTVLNTGNVHVETTGTVLILDERDQLLGRVPLTKVLVMPGREGKLTGNWVGEVPPGSYTALATIIAGGTAAVLEEKFSVP